MYYLPSIPLLALSSVMDERLDNHFGVLCHLIEAPYAIHIMIVLCIACRSVYHALQIHVLTPASLQLSPTGVAKTILMRLIIGMGGCAIIAVIFPFEPSRLGYWSLFETELFPLTSLQTCFCSRDNSSTRTGYFMLMWRSSAVHVSR